MLSSSVVDHGFELRSGQTKETNIDICFLSAKQAAISRKIKDCVGSEAGEREPSNMPVPSQGHYGFHSFPVVD